MTNQKIMYEVLFGFLIWNTNICLISRIFDNASMVDKTGVKNDIFGWGSSYPKMKFLGPGPTSNPTEIGVNQDISW